MTAARILVVDDEPDFVRWISDVLKGESLTVLVAKTGPEAIAVATASVPDLVLLDWGLPGKDGVEVCKSLKADPRTQRIPVVMLTARGREMDVVLGLEMGAQDFITKRALRPRELVARVRAALRVSAAENEPNAVLRSGELVLDESRREVVVNGRAVALRPKEFDVLKLFLQKRGRVLTRRFLCEAVWGSEFLNTSRAIDTTISRLRSELGNEGKKIQAIVGVGYKFDEGEERPLR